MSKPLSSKKTTKASINICKIANVQRIVPEISHYAAEFLQKHETLSRIYQKWLDNGGATDGGSNRAFWLYIEIKEKVLAMLPESQRSAGQKAFADLDSLVSMAMSAPPQPATPTPATTPAVKEPAALTDAATREAISKMAHADTTRTLYQNHCYYRRLFVRGLNPGDTFPYSERELADELDAWLHEYEFELEKQLSTTPFLRPSDKERLLRIARAAANTKEGDAMRESLKLINLVRDVTHKCGSMPVAYTHSMQDRVITEGENHV